ncbi:MAG: DUF1566 domain-containing protein [Treponema sp.]|nr:DUF1566 domain-containing protein [Treponema sp.]
MKKFLMILVALVAMMTAAMAQSSTKKMAVATFEIMNNAVTADEADIITELYIAELVATGKVTVVDRTYFDKLIKEEMKFQSSDWADKEKTLALGTAVGAEILARGQIMKMGSKLYISATVINGKTAAILSSGRKQFSNIDEIFDLLPQFSKDVVASLTLKVGDVGPGGGIVFYIEGNRAWECSELLGQADWEDAKTMCKNYRGGGYSDWYLPTKDELNNIYQNLRRTGKIITNDWYWSSSPSSNGLARNQRFSDGYQYYGVKDGTSCVRAVRAFSN